MSLANVMSSTIQHDDEEMHTDARVNLDLLSQTPLAALLPLLQLLRQWGQASEDNVIVEQLSGAMTNLVYKCSMDTNGKVHLALVRVHASKSDLFDRHGEIATFRAVSSAGVGPKLLLLFGNGRIEEFLGDHITLSAEDMKQPGVAAAIAKAMAAFHFELSATLAGSPYHEEPQQVWPRMRQWLAMALQLWSAEEPLYPRLLALKDKIDELEQQLNSTYPCGVALCHNDLQYGNIMILRGWSPEPVAAVAAAADLAAAPAASSGLGSAAVQDDVAVNNSSSTAGDRSSSSAAAHKPARSSTGSDLSHCSDQDAGGSTAGAAKLALPALRLPGQLGSAGGKRPGMDSVQQQALGEEDDLVAGSPPLGLSPRHPSSRQAAIRLIDYEYSGFNPVAFDIANYWCEWAADYHTDTPHVLDFSRLPDRQQRQAYVRKYLQALLACLDVQVQQGQQGLQGQHVQQADEAVKAAAARPSPAAAAGRLPLQAWVQQYLTSSLLEQGSTAGRAAQAEAAPAGLAGDTSSEDDDGWEEERVVAAAMQLANRVGALQVTQQQQDGAGSRMAGSVVSAAAFAAMVSDLTAAAGAYLAVSHLHWALWGYIQARISDVDFEFMSYAEQRMQQLGM